MGGRSILAKLPQGEFDLGWEIETKGESGKAVSDWFTLKKTCWTAKKKEFHIQEYHSFPRQAVRLLSPKGVAMWSYVGARWEKLRNQ